MNNIFEKTFWLDDREADQFGHLRMASLMALSQEVATGQAQLLSFSREELVEQINAVWMVVRAKYWLTRPVYRYETLKIQTWYRTVKSATVYRDFAFFVGEEKVGGAVTAWILADEQSHRILRANKLLAHLDTALDLPDPETLSRIRLPETMELAEARQMRYSDADVNGHVNNARYADFACDAIHMENMAGIYPACMHINFTSECRPGETIELLTGEAAGGCFYVQGKGQEGKSRFEILLEMKEKLR